MVTNSIMRILILEDDGYRVTSFIEALYNHTLDIIENAYEAIRLLESNVYDLILLDHDLGEGNGSGTVVTSFLRTHRDNPNNNALVIIHSWNIPASNTMLNDLPNALRIPFNTEGFFEALFEVSRRGAD